MSIPYALEGIEHGKGVLNGSTAIAEMLVAAISEFAEVTVVTDRPDRFSGHRTVSIFRENPIRAHGFEEFWRREYRVFGAPTAGDFSRDSLYRVFQLANAVDPGRLDAILAETDCEVVVLNRQEHFFLSRHPGLCDRKLVFFTHDSHYQRKLSYEENYGAAQPLTHVEQAIESAFVAEAGKLVTISVEEQTHFSRLATGCEVVLFRPTIARPQRLVELAEQTAVRFYFIGVNNFVNRQTMARAHEWFLENGRPGADEFHVFGSVCHAVEAVGADQGVFLHGHVDDLACAVAGMHVLLAPIQSGSGVPLKVADALGAGHLVLASAFGADSYPEFIGSRIVLSDGDAGQVLDALRAAPATYVPYEAYASKNRQAARQIVGVE
ncbi:hypothetical protein GCM10027046_27640 [Uliginosibacterium flavum]|uniref:Glycosyltransferase n=1 Tax=Uliginosibacterium flavum TaxID=1396831 RepID=A0ABV2TJM5_9RHOO